MRRTLASLALALAMASCATPAKASETENNLQLQPVHPCQWGCWWGPVDEHPHAGPFGTVIA